MRFLSATRKQRRTYVPRLVVGFVVGFVFGFVSWLVNVLGRGLVLGFTPEQQLQWGLLNGLIGGLVSGLALGFAYGGAASEQSHVRIRIADGIRKFRKRLVPQLAIGYAGGFGFGFVYWLVSQPVIGLVRGSEGGIMSFLESGLTVGLMSGLGYGPVVGLVYGLAVALENPIAITAAVSPSDLLTINRRAVVYYLLVSGLTFGLVGWLFYGLNGMFVDWLVFALVGGLGAGLAYSLSLTAWGHWVALARIWLPLTGRLPWDTSAFLHDAHQRGVLRQVGTVYQFRHAQLKDHLARAYRTDQ